MGSFDPGAFSNAFDDLVPDPDNQVAIGSLVVVGSAQVEGSTTGEYVDLEADPAEIGMEIDIAASLDISPPAEPVPYAAVLADPWIRRNSSTYPNPAFAFDEDTGVMGEWEPTSEYSVPWGRPRVTVNSVDMTFWRGAPCKITSFEIDEPFGDATAVIEFPQMTPFDDYLEVLPKWAEVRIDWVTPDDEVFDNLWCGSIASYDEGHPGMTIQCVGAFYEIDRFLRKPVFYDASADAANHIVTTVNYFILYYNLNLAVMAGVSPIGIPMRARGGYDKAGTEYIAKVLAQSAPNPDQIWTLACHDRTPELVLKDLNHEHWQLQAGARGVDLSGLTHDIVSTPSVIYGEGVDENNCHWRNSHHTADYGQAFVWPIASHPNVEKILLVRDPDDPHTVIGFGTDPNYDPDIARIEHYVNYGTGIGKDVATNAANAKVAKFENQAWVGTIRLTTDPAEGSRFQMRAGQNIKLKRFHKKDVVFHIAKVRHSFDSLETTLTVDTEGRDYLDVAAIYKRNQEAREDPRARLKFGRNSRQTEDRIAVWDCESGAGILPYTVTVANAWHQIPIIGAEMGQVVRSQFHTETSPGIGTSTASEFAIAIFDRPVLPATMAGLGDPTSEDFWEQTVLDDMGLLIGWGGEDTPGYWPGRKSQGDGMTGYFRDTASWNYRAQIPPFMYALVWVDRGGLYFSGRLYPSDEFEIV